MMMKAELQTKESARLGISRSGIRGFSLLEIVMVLLVGSVLTAMAIPKVQSGLYLYRLNSAVAMVKWAIQSTRFQALQKGYPYQVAISSSANTYQIQNLPSGSTYQNVGSAVPVTSASITINQDTTINFKPNGAVTETVGSNTFTLVYQGTTATITVSNYGNVTVSCSPANLVC